MIQGKTHEGLVSGDKLRGAEWYLCDRCANAEPNWKFPNLSIDGQPVQVWCKYHAWNVVRGTVRDCNRFKPNK